MAQTLQVRLDPETRERLEQFAAQHPGMTTSAAARLVLNLGFTHGDKLETAWRIQTYREAVIAAKSRLLKGLNVAIEKALRGE